jgi:predicted TIM-barrel fold metal-dependent hydrolase
LIENKPLYVLGLAVTGKPYQEHRPSGVNYEGNPGTGSPEQRLSEQDRDGVDAEVMFTGPGNVRFWRGIQEDAAFDAVVHAYNEFLAEEYCAAARDRLLAMAVIPTTGVESAVKEMEYCARAGLKGVMLANFPSGKGFPTPEDDRFWAAATDLKMPLTAHVKFFTDERPVFRYKRRPTEAESFAVDPVFNLVRFAGESALNAVQMIMAGVFDRFPKLRIYWAETMIGWIPYFLSQLEDNWERTRYWAGEFYGLEAPARPLSEYIREHCFWGFIKDPFGVMMRHHMAVGRLMWATDFPHAASDWPNSRKVIEEIFNGVPAEEKSRMVAGNAIEFFQLDS